MYISEKSVGAPPIAHLLCANPHIDVGAIVQLLETVPANTSVLFVGHHNVWVLFHLARSLPHLHFVGFDENSSVIDKARATISYLGLTNVSYKTSTFDNFLNNRGGLTFNVVLYVPKLHTARTFGVSHASRLNSALKYFCLTAPGGMLIMCAALCSRGSAAQQLDNGILDRVYAGYQCHGLLSRWVGMEIGDLQGGVVLHLMQFLLTHAGMGYELPISYAQYRVPPILPHHMVSLAQGSYCLYQPEHLWRENYVMYLEDFVTLLTLFGLDIRIASTKTCERLNTIWSLLFGFETSLLETLQVSGLIVAQKS
jgi:hypothetical protein